MSEPVAIGGESRASEPAGRPSTPLLLFGVAGGPVAWNAQLLANYALADYPCFPGDAARSQPLPGWGGSWVVLLVINLIAVAVTFACVAIGTRGWRWARHARGVEGVHGVPATRALSIGALLFGVVFCISTVFALIALLLAPQCSG